MYKVISEIISKNSSGKLITIQEIFFRLMSLEYFMFTRQFSRIDVSSKILNRDYSSKTPDYIEAYLGRPEDISNLSLFDFMKKVIFIIFDKLKCYHSSMITRKKENPSPISRKQNILL